MYGYNYGTQAGENVMKLHIIMNKKGIPNKIKGFSIITQLCKFEYVCDGWTISDFIFHNDYLKIWDITPSISRIQTYYDEKSIFNDVMNKLFKLTTTYRIYLCLLNSDYLIHDIVNRICLVINDLFYQYI